MVAFWKQETTYFVNGHLIGSDWQYMCPNFQPQIFQVLEDRASLKTQINQSFFMELILLGAWAILKTKKAFNFQNK
jgi:hypothetical protein